MRGLTSHIKDSRSSLQNHLT